MSLLDRIQDNLNSFTKGERLAAEYILKYPIDVIRYSAEAIAENANTSRSNVVRLCKKLGYSGFSEFKYDLKHNIHTSPMITPSSPNEVNTIKEHSLYKFMAIFEQMSFLYNCASLEQMSNFIFSANKICIAGYYHSYFSAQQLAFRLNRFGLGAQAIYDDSIINSYADILKDTDLFILFSISGSKKYLDTIKAYKKNNVKIILITMTEHAPISTYSDITIVLPCITRQYSDALLDDAPVFYMFIEILMEKLSFIETDL